MSEHQLGDTGFLVRRGLVSVERDFLLDDLVDSCCLIFLRRVFVGSSNVSFEVRFFLVIAALVRADFVVGGDDSWAWVFWVRFASRASFRRRALR